MFHFYGSYSECTTFLDFSLPLIISGATYHIIKDGKKSIFIGITTEFIHRMYMHISVSYLLNSLFGEFYSESTLYKSTRNMQCTHIHSC